MRFKLFVLFGMLILLVGCYVAPAPYYVSAAQSTYIPPPARTDAEFTNAEQGQDGQTGLAAPGQPGVATPPATVYPTTYAYQPQMWLWPFWWPPAPVGPAPADPYYWYAPWPDPFFLFFGPWWGPGPGPHPGPWWGHGPWWGPGPGPRPGPGWGPGPGPRFGPGPRPR